MNRDAVDLRKFFFDAVFESSSYVVHLGDWQRAPHRAVARSEDVVFHLADANVVAIYKFIEFGGQAVQELLNRLREQFHFSGV